MIIKKYKIVNKFRFLVFILSILITISFIVFLISLNKANANDTKIYKEITVQNGDDLWKIARDNATEDYKDLREYIYEIRNFNKMDSAIIYPGQIIKIP